MTAIKGTYSGLKQIKTRKVWVLEIEVPEEAAHTVTDLLGFPSHAKEKWVAVAKLNQAVIEERREPYMELVKKAVMLCKNAYFQEFLSQVHGAEQNESSAILTLYKLCGIKSRSELKCNAEAKKEFDNLMDYYQQWKVNQEYEDNLAR